MYCTHQKCEVIALEYITFHFDFSTLGLTMSHGDDNGSQDI